MALVTAAQVISNLPIFDASDPAFITPIVDVVSLQQLRPIMTSGYYDDVIASGWLVDGVVNISGYSATASGVLSTMLTSYVLPLLYWSIGTNALEEFNAQTGNAGIVNFNPDGGSNKEKLIQRKINTWQGYTQVYKDRLQQYIIDNANNNGFEGYANANKPIEKILKHLIL